MLDIIFVAIIFIVSSIYLLLKQRYLYWEKRGVPYLKPRSLICGNDYDLVLGKLSFPETILRNYKELAPHRFGGTFSFINPILYVRDPNLVKSILTKDFNHFADRSPEFADRAEPLTMHLFNLCGDEWKWMRAKLTPTFTSGKMKMMFALVKECADQLGLCVDEKITRGETVEVKDVMARYTTDVISSCAFGLQANSLKNPKSEFCRMGRKVFTPTFRTQLRDVMFSLNAKFTKLIKFRNITADVTDFFNKVVNDTIKYRNENNVSRNDFLNLLMALLNSEKDQNDTGKGKLDFNIDLLVAQCFVFFLAGFETSSNALSFSLYELARNEQVRKKLQSEVERILNKHDGQITYEALQEMTYMDNVINETLRLYPAVAFLIRMCVMDYPVPDSDFVIKKGEILFVPINGMHHDAQYFPNPESFHPERFSENAETPIPNYCFLPFGEGPRICIGMRFGIMQIKSALAVILRNYDFTVAPSMVQPIEFRKHSVLTTTKDEIVLKFERRLINE